MTSGTAVRTRTTDIGTVTRQLHLQGWRRARLLQFSNFVLQELIPAAAKKPGINAFLKFHQTSLFKEANPGQASWV